MHCEQVHVSAARLLLAAVRGEVLFAGATATPSGAVMARALAMRTSPRVIHVTRRSPAEIPRIRGRTSVPEMVEDNLAPRNIR